MAQDPVEEWRRLTALYAEMGEVEIRELADQINDLMPTAQQILREEMKKRGVTNEPTTPEEETTNGSQAVVHWERWEGTAAEADDSKESRRQYTWKTGLCRCDSVNEASARCEMLRRAGIETWIQRPGSRFVIPWVDELGVGDIQINVAADQLEDARMIVAKSIPQEILDGIEEEDVAPEYEIPVCPKCKTADPVLESVEPSNSWLCESCGYTWSDPVSEFPER
jgi:hypothetical protein